MMWLSFSTAIFLAAVLHLSAIRAAEENSVCYVRPPNVTCRYSRCYTLQEYATDDRSVASQCRLGRSKIVYRFLDDDKHLLLGNISLSFLLADSVSLIGNWTNGTHGVSGAQIECRGSGGIIFQSTSNVLLSHLTITNCGRLFDKHNIQASIALYHTHNFTISNLVVNNSAGYGLHASCAMGNMKIESTVFAHNQATTEKNGGNAGFLYKNCSVKRTLLSISFSHFIDGFNQHNHSLASGLWVFVWTSEVNVELDNISAVGNRGGDTTLGGNLLIILRNQTSILNNSVVVKDSYLAEGSAYTGGGMYINILDTFPYTNNSREFEGNQTTPEIVNITNTVFVNNHATHEGGGLYIITHEDPRTFSLIGRMIISDCHFKGNSLKNDFAGGVALHLANHYVLAYLNHSDPQFITSVINCTIEGNSLLSDTSNIQGVVFTASSALFIIQNPSGVLVKDSRIVNNNCTGITVLSGTVLFSGEVSVCGNRGTNGGGLIMCNNGLMILRPHTTLYVRGNTARHAGGGIYAEVSCMQSEPPCFYQLDIEFYRNNSLLNTVQVVMSNNTAEYAGSDIFGGSVSYCFLFPQYVPDLKKSGGEMFKEIFHIQHSSSDLSQVSSEPFKVCFCGESGSYLQHKCQDRSIKRTIYPGKRLSIHVFTVGQENGVAPYAVSATLLSRDSHINHSDYLQDANDSCTPLNYKVYSDTRSDVMVLQVHKQSGISSEASKFGIAQVNLTFKPCPIGFTLTSGRCDCIRAFKSAFICNIEKLKIKKNAHHPFIWIGCYALTNCSSNNYSCGSGYGVMIQKHCPYDFCHKKEVSLKTGENLSDFDNDNSLCAYNRSGIACGECKAGLSLILGSSACWKCNDRYHLSLIVVFAIAGLLLVFLLIVTDLSVSSGTLSGLLFYANVVQTNSPVFFGPHLKESRVYMCSLFISWLNLDFGIKTCFFDGMDAVGKTWLQFAFPLYVWAIAGVIILWSRRLPSKYVAGRSPVRILATLFLLSYAKLLRTIIRALAFDKLSLFTTDHQLLEDRRIWREDGKIDYMRGKHLPLFAVAIAFCLVTLPYAFVLFSIQWLQRSTHLRPCSWIVRLKPFFDAYTAPYKTYCRFWTGLLLIIRVLLFLAFTSPHVHDSVRLSLILATCVTVQMVAWSFHGVYRSKYTDAVNSAFLLNLGLFSALTSYTVTTDSKHQVSVILLSVCTSFCLFVCILVYHTIVFQVKGTQLWNHVEAWIKKKKCFFSPRLRRKGRSEERCSTAGESRRPVTQTFIDPFNVEYREPLISSSLNSYGTNE